MVEADYACGSEKVGMLAHNLNGQERGILLFSFVSFWSSPRPQWDVSTHIQWRYPLLS